MRGNKSNVEIRFRATISRAANFVPPLRPLRPVPEPASSRLAHRRSKSENWRTSLNHSNEDDDDRQNQQDVDQPGRREGGGHSQCPHDKQNDSNSPKHVFNAPYLVLGKCTPVAIYGEHCEGPTPR